MNYIYMLTDTVMKVDGIFSFMQPLVNFFKDLGHYGLALYTFIEVLLVIPPIEFVLWPLILLNPENWLIYVLNVMIFNLISAAIGYFIGAKIGYAILKFFTSEEIINKTHVLFEKYGVIAVVVGAFTPIPFTIVVYLSGISKINFWKYIGAVFAGRLPRYLLGAFFVKKLGEKYVVEIYNYINIISFVLLFVFVLYFLFMVFKNYYLDKKTKVE